MDTGPTPQSAQAETHAQICWSLRLRPTLRVSTLQQALEVTTETRRREYRRGLSAQGFLQNPTAGPPIRAPGAPKACGPNVSSAEHVDMKVGRWRSLP